MDRQKLTNGEIDAALEELPGWEVVNGRLRKSYKFGSFARAIGWMVSVSFYADKIDHHPNWSNVYNRVSVELWTHDMDALSTFDIALARQMDKFAQP
jgi:4a-hydroxytetrahydrobiopterin dehydratase